MLGLCQDAHLLPASRPPLAIAYPDAQSRQRLDTGA